MSQHPPANELTKHLSGMHFPAKKNELTEHANSWCPDDSSRDNRSRPAFSMIAYKAPDTESAGTVSIDGLSLSGNQGE
ncbi:MAG: hypothetical protein GVY22_03775 [Gammaproteobacteria bacterium]|jgi:hypothetical protein|nr:hypothetical protein [Gammaproteobacteria bacterium]